MGSNAVEKPHAVCVPFPAQGHVNPMFKLAKLLHHKGFHITFVNTEFNHRRLLRSRGPSSLDGVPDFRFETIPDGLPPSDVDGTQDIPSLCDSTMRTCLGPFRDLLAKLNSSCSSGVPPVTCIVSDGVMSWTLDAAEELGLPEVLFWTTSACGFMGYLHYKDLIQRGFTPLRDESYLTNGFLEQKVDGIAGMDGIRFKDLPSFVRTTDPNDIMLNFLVHEATRVPRASAVILNTFRALEAPVLDAMAPLVPPVHTVGPLCLLTSHIPDDNPLASMGSNLWKEDLACLDWLDGRAPGSVVYVNFGSITVMTNQQKVEFAWGLANCKHDFLWVIRPDLVKGDTAVLPEEFLEETKGRGLLASWCKQEQVLSHPAIGGFLTHNGWNSTVESVSGGVPMVCWPFFAEQQTNCRYACEEWGIGMEINSDVRRGEVEGLIRELMCHGGEEGKRMRRKAEEWKSAAIAATQQGGRSFADLDKLVNHLRSA